MTREEARQVLQEKIDNSALFKDERDAFTMAIEALQTDAEQGEWIIHGEPPWFVRECSECGAKWHQWSGDKTPNYCGNCGARMTGGAE